MLPDLTIAFVTGMMLGTILNFSVTRFMEWRCTIAPKVAGGDGLDWAITLRKRHDEPRSIPAPSRLPIATDWDVAQAVESLEPNRIDYRFLGVTGEEDA